MRSPGRCGQRIPQEPCLCCVIFRAVPAEMQLSTCCFVLKAVSVLVVLMSSLACRIQTEAIFPSLRNQQSGIFKGVKSTPSNTSPCAAAPHILQYFLNLRCAIIFSCPRTYTCAIKPRHLSDFATPCLDPAPTEGKAKFNWRYVFPVKVPTRLPRLKVQVHRDTRPTPLFA